MKTLSFERTTEPDFSGWHFYVEAGQKFDPKLLAEAHNFDLSEVDPSEISKVEREIEALKKGEWLKVELAD